LTDDKSRNEAVDEFLADLAGKEEFQKQPLFKKIAAAFRQFLRRIPGFRSIALTDGEIASMLRKSYRQGTAPGTSTSSGETRFMVNENGQSLFQVQGKQGNLTAEEILSDKSIKPSDFILDANGNLDWARITNEIAESGKKYGLEALPIRLCRGKHFSNHEGYGLEHIHSQHGEELRDMKVDISEMLSLVFNRPSAVYARIENGDVYLEIAHNTKPKTIGILQIRKQNGFYSIVTAYIDNKENLNFKGKQIWKFEKPLQIKSKQRTNAVEPLMGEKLLQPTLEGSGSKSVSNINPFGYSASPESGKNEKIRFSLAERSNEELGNELARFCLPLVEKRLDHQSIRDVVETALLEQGFADDEKMIDFVAERAKLMLSRRQATIRARRDADYIDSVDNYVYVLRAKFGSDFKIKPTSKYAGEEFSGSWMQKQKNGSGVPEDEAAEVLSREWGREVTDDEVIDHFADLKKRDILAKRGVQKKRARSFSAQKKSLPPPPACGKKLVKSPFCVYIMDRNASGKGSDLEAGKTAWCRPSRE